MKISKELIQSLLSMQHDMNSKINPKWVDAGYPFLRAVVVEGAELMDHLTWKWWKKEEPNMPQAQLEVVDLFHFILSAILIDARGDIDAAREWLEKRVAALDGPDSRKAWLLEKEFRLDTMDLLEKTELLIGFSVFRKISIPLFDAILEDCQMSWDELYRQYVGKNTLNMFRQDYGYKTGEYRKTWRDGREDNEHLAEIALGEDVTPDYKDVLYQKLLVRYEA